MYPIFAPTVPASVYIVNSDVAACVRLAKALQAPERTVRSFASGAAFLAAAQPDQPSCVLVATPTNGPGRLAFQQRLRARQISMPVIFLGGGGIASAVRALKAGAFDFLSAPLRSAKLQAAVEKALEKDREQRQYASWRKELRRRLQTLTVREGQVMALVMDGMLNREVAQTLALSEISVKVHRASVMRKMGAATLVELVRMNEVLHPSMAGSAGTAPSDAF